MNNDRRDDESEHEISNEMISGVVEHMNDDHADACLVIAQTLGGKPAATTAIMASIDSLGVDFIVQLLNAGKENVRVNFEKPVTRDAQMRGHLVAMTKRARKAAL